MTVGLDLKEVDACGFHLGVWMFLFNQCCSSFPALFSAGVITSFSLHHTGGSASHERAKPRKPKECEHLEERTERK